MSRWRKGSVLGNMASAAYRMRRIPANAARARRAAAADPAPAAPSRPRRTEYRAVYVIPAGPGDWEPLEETIESVLAYEGDEAKVVVVDDGTVDCRRAVVRSRFPEVDVARRRPSGGPPRNLSVITDGIEFALRRYSFDVLIKMDTDALVTGASPSLDAARLFEARPEVGMAGTIYFRADGEPENYEFDSWVLPHTERWSPGARRMMRRAREGGYDGAKVHGGIYMLSRPALDAIAASGDVSWRSPWWTPLGEDFWLSMIVLANGFQLASNGGPGESVAVASKFTPIPNRRVLDEGTVAIHSVRRGCDGESEDQVRAFFRREREGSQAGSASASGTEASGPPER